MSLQLHKEQKWLQQLVGEWFCETEVISEPGQAPQRFISKESVRMLNDAWVVCEGEYQMPDGSISTTVITIGYDAQKHCFIGSLIPGTMTYLWIYRGSLVGNVLTLHTEGPHIDGSGRLAKYKDVIEMFPNGRRIMTSWILGDHGQWRKCMPPEYRHSQH